MTPTQSTAEFAVESVAAEAAELAAELAAPDAPDAKAPRPIGAADLSFDDIEEGLAVQGEYQITPVVYHDYLRAFGDRSPVHVDPRYAQQRGFQSCVMHGGILHGFLSHFLGMRLPGRRGLLLTADLRYLRPSYLGDQLILRVRVERKVAAVRVLHLRVEFDNLTQGVKVAHGRVQVAVSA